MQVLRHTKDNASFISIMLKMRKSKPYPPSIHRLGHFNLTINFNLYLKDGQLMFTSIFIYINPLAVYNNYGRILT